MRVIGGEKAGVRVIGGVSVIGGEKEGVERKRE